MRLGVSEWDKVSPCTLLDWDGLGHSQLFTQLASLWSYWIFVISLWGTSFRTPKFISISQRKPQVWDRGYCVVEGSWNEVPGGLCQEHHVIVVFLGTSIISFLLFCFAVLFPYLIPEGHRKSLGSLAKSTLTDLSLSCCCRPSNAVNPTRAEASSQPRLQHEHHASYFKIIYSLGCLKLWQRKSLCSAIILSLIL